METVFYSDYLKTEKTESNTVIVHAIPVLQKTQSELPNEEY